MVMKPIAVFVLVAVFSLGVVAASAKTVNAPQNDSERITATTAGPDKGTRATDNDMASVEGAIAAQPSKKTLKKSKIQQKPPLHDPN
jgi:hypothetical protein